MFDLREIVNSFPPRIINLFFILLLTGVSYIGYFLSKKFFSHVLKEEEKSIADNIMSILGNGYSIFLGFIVINCWNYSVQTRNFIYQEVNALEIIVQQSQQLSSSSKNLILQEVKNYILTVKNDEWKEMKHGKSSPKAQKNVNLLGSTIYSELSKNSDRASIEYYYYNLINTEFSLLLTARFNRLNQLNTLISPLLLETLLIGGLVTVFIMGFLKGNRKFLDFASIIGLNMLLGFNMGIIVNFSYPFSSDLALAEEMYGKKILEELKVKSSNIPKLSLQKELLLSKHDSKMP